MDKHTFVECELLEYIFGFFPTEIYTKDEAKHGYYGDGLYRYSSYIKLDTSHSIKYISDILYNLFNSKYLSSDKTWIEYLVDEHKQNQEREDKIIEVGVEAQLFKHILHYANIDLLKFSIMPYATLIYKFFDMVYSDTNLTFLQILEKNHREDAKNG